MSSFRVNRDAVFDSITAENIAVQTLDAAQSSYASSTFQVATAVNGTGYNIAFTVSTLRGGMTGTPTGEATLTNVGPTGTNSYQYFSSEINKFLVNCELELNVTFPVQFKNIPTVVTSVESQAGSLVAGENNGIVSITPVCENVTTTGCTTRVHILLSSDDLPTAQAFIKGLLLPPDPAHPARFNVIAMA